jgi:hypothetical protein
MGIFVGHVEGKRSVVGDDAKEMSKEHWGVICRFSW